MKQRISARNIAPLLTILTWIVTMLVPYSSAFAAVPAGYSEYFIPGGEDQLWAIYVDLDNDPVLVEADGMHAVIAVTSAADDTTIYYDHWEDGYDAVPATPGPSTEIFTLDIGDVQEFESSNIPIPRGTSLNVCNNDGVAPATEPCYDGRDRIYVAGGAVTVTRASWAESIETVYALAWEIYPTEPFLTNYTIPVGENLAGSPTLYDDFDRVYVIVQSTTNGNSVQIDDPATPGVDVTATLNEGETTQLYSISAGTTVAADDPVQVQFIVGQFAAGQASESRGYSAVPDSLWDNEYYSPVGGFSAGNTDLYLYNPNSYTINVNFEDSIGTGGFTIPPDSTVSYGDGAGRLVPLNSGVYLSSSDIFWGIGSGDTEAYNYDWGYSLVPAYALSDEYFLGWAPGTAYPPAPGDPGSGSPAYVTPVLDNTTVFVDYSPTDGTPDVSYTLDRLDSQKIFDPDYDNTGMHIYATGPIAVAWGEDPDTATIYSPYLDLGYTTLPLSPDWMDVVLSIDKTADPSVLPDEANQVSTFTLVITSYDYPVDDVDVIDTLPDDWSYVAGTTLIDGVSAADPSISGQELTWNLNRVMGINDSFTVVFQAQTDNPFPSPPFGYSENIAQAVGTRLSGAQIFSPTDSAFVFFTSLTIDKDTSTPSVSIGGTATYTIELENIGAVAVTNVTVADSLPAGFTYIDYGVVEVDAFRTSTQDPFSGASNLNWGTWDIDPGGTVTITFIVDIAITTPDGTYDNTVTADSTEVGAIDDDGNAAQDTHTPSGEDPEDDEDVTVLAPVLTIDKDTSTPFAEAGGTASYTILIENSGGADATNVTISDTLPAGFTFASQTITATSAPRTSITDPSVGDSVLNWGTWTIQPGGSVEIDFVVDIGGGVAQGTYDNTAAATSTETGAIDDDGTAAQDADTPPAQDPENDEDVTIILMPDLDVTKTSSAAGNPVSPGDTISYTILITNNGVGRATDVVVFDSLPTGTAYVAESTVATRPQAITDTFRDEFNNQAYDNNDGTASWATNWVEFGDDGSPTGQDEQILNDVSNYQLRLGDNDGGGEGVRREVDLTGYDSATISLLYRRGGLEDVTEYVEIQISDDGGSSWNPIGQFAGPGTDATYQTFSYDISGDISATMNTTIRLITSATMDQGIFDNDYVYFDNIEIAATDAAFTLDNVPGGLNPDLADGDPPDLIEAGDGIMLDPGNTLTVTYDVTVDDPLGAGITEISNLVSVTSTEIPTPVEDTVTDPVAATIGDFVWDDLNGDGVQDGGEPGIDGVTIDLIEDTNGNGVIDVGEPVLATQATAGSGAYDFTGLDAGDYIVDVTDTGSVLTGYVLTGGTDPDPVTGLSAGEDYNDSDFGYQLQTASIGDFVWNDLDGDGVQDGGEPGIDSVTIDLIEDTNGNGVIDVGEPVLATQTTAGGGAYDFTGLTAGDYIVDVTDTGGVLTGYVLTGGTDPDPVTGLTVGQDYNDSDFGYQQTTASIGDFVWDDLNGDGVQDGGEPGIDGVTIDLIEDTNGNGVIDVGEPVLATTTTAGGGAYDFTGLAAGDYIVDVTDTGGVLTGYVLTGGTDPDPVTGLSAGEDYNDSDFGYQLQTASIGDFVWNDLDGDGVQNGGEPGIDGVTIDLIEDTNGNGVIDVGEPVLATQTTAGGGAYDFTGLTAGDYIVDVTDTGGVLTGYVLTGGTDPDPVTGLAAGADYNDSDFGYQLQTASIGDFVWDDLNGDGVQDGGEPGLGGIDVRLYSDPNGDGDPSDGVLLDTQTTDGLGAYDFTGLAAGNYVVDVDFATVPVGYVLTGGTDPHAVTGLTAGEDYNDADFGYQLFGSSIGDFVWNDLDGDGVQDGGEPGLSGIDVRLYSDPNGDGDPSDGVLLDTQTTDGFGAYIFALLGAGNYVVDVDDATLPAGYVLTGGTDPHAVTGLAVGEDYDDADFGYQLQTASIGDFVWNDLDGDGVQDGGEPGIDGVTIDLIEDTNGNGVIDVGEPVLATTTTAGGGAYDFTGLAAGDYIVDVTDTGGVLTGYVLTGGTDPDPVTGLTAGEDYNDSDFGYQLQTASIGDFVWNDLDGDGVQDGGEPGIDGVTIDLIEDTNGNGVIDVGEPVLATTTTAGGGAYDFTGLAAGDYIVDVTDTGGVLTGYVLTGGTDPDPVTGLSAGEDYNDSDFGYQLQTASIGDFVWDDLDGDGVQDGGEPGIDGVTIDLIEDTNGNGVIDVGEPVLATQTTAGGGAYDFTGLAAGDYIVDVTDTGGVLTGYVLTGGTDPDPVTGLSAGEDYNDSDFGYQLQTASIGDFVWNDLDGDGVQDGGEPGIDGVTIDLIEDTNGNGVIDVGESVLATTTTAGGGAYDFTGLAAGDYIVDVTDTGGVLTGYVLTGGTDPDPVTGLSAGEDYNDSDFGYQLQTASIGDFVWNDLDGDGVQDGGEPGIDGVTIDLIEDTNGNGVIDVGEPVLATTTTAGGGAYDFTGLAAGDYIVDVTDTGGVLTGYVLTGGTDPDPVTGLSAGEDYNDSDFGYQLQTASIGDFVWNDLDGDGVQDGGEPGIDGVTIDLIEDTNGNGVIDVGEPVLATTTTAGGGAYDFTGLAAGDYIVDVTDTGGVLTGYVLTGGTDPDPVTGLAAGADYNDSDFGYQLQTASIGDFVWNDLDGDGVQDGGEPGIDGVTIDLIEDTNGNGVIDVGEPVLATQTTAGGGAYDFTGLAAGDYIVDVTDTGGVLTGYVLTGGTDPDPVTGLAAGADYNDSDFGYQLPTADLSLIKVVNDTSPDLGDTVTFTLTLNNSGPDTATNIVVEDVIPAGLTYVPGSISGGDSNDDTGLPVLTWDINSLTSGTSAILTFQAMVDVVGTSTNIAQVIASDQYDPDSAPDNDDGDQSEDDEDNASVTVATIIDPALTKTGDPATASVGDTVVFTITVENEGNTDALDVEIIDTLPIFLDVIDVTVVPDEGQPISIVGNTVTVDMGTVSPTDFYTITITTEVNALGEPPGGTNSVGLTTSSLDEDLTNNDDDFFLAIVVPGGLPETGFAPGVVTSLPAQLESERYTSYFTLGLEIPKLDVDIPIVGVPETAEGWDVTWLWDNAGYLQGTAFPTWEGNTAITGHVTLPSGLPGPFAKLGTLSWGDEIVINFFGMRYIYSVREVRWVRPGDTSTLGHEELDWVTLITCSGYDGQSGAYLWRTVVRAVLINVEPQH